MVAIGGTVVLELGFASCTSRADSDAFSEDEGSSSCMVPLADGINSVAMGSKLELSDESS